MTGEELTVGELRQLATVQKETISVAEPEEELAAMLLRSAGVNRIVKQRDSLQGGGLEYRCVWSGYSEADATV